MNRIDIDSDGYTTDDTLMELANRTLVDRSHLSATPSTDKAKRETLSQSQRCDEEAQKTPTRRGPLSNSMRKGFLGIKLTPSSSSRSRGRPSTECPLLVNLSDSEDDDSGGTDSASSLPSLFDHDRPLQDSMSSIEPTRKRPPSREISPTPAKPRKSFQKQNPSRLQPKPLPFNSQAPLAPIETESSSTDKTSFFASLWGSQVNLNPHIIAHNWEIQKIFDHPQAPVSWGVQFELARGVNHDEWNWDLVERKCEYFAGKSDADVLHKVRHIMKDLPPGKVYWDDNLGKEFDREQAAVVENKSRGLGLMGFWYGEDDWYGGKIQQIVILVKENVSFKLRMEPLEMRRSTRLARYLGSRRLLQVRIQKELLEKQKDDVVNFLSQKFILNGRVFVATPPKDDGVYLVEVNQDYERTASDLLGDQYRRSLDEILNWHNPIELNSKQPISKYGARAGLTLSNSIPALLFEAENIKFIRDITANPDEEKPPAERVMTDGCGFINEAAMLAITRALNYPSLPTAIQARIAGSKGLWTLHPNDTSSVPTIYIRDSQRKIVYPNFDAQSGTYTYLDRAHRILDLLHSSHSFAASGIFSLSKQIVLNMSNNGVPHGVLKKLMKAGLEEIIIPLTDWDRPHADINLFDAVQKLGRVLTMRMQRLAQGRSRALGFSGRDWGHTAVSPDEKDNGVKNEVAADPKQAGDASVGISCTGRNPFSQEPYSLHELTLEMVQAGFDPRKDRILQQKIRWILKNAIDSAVEKCHIPLPEGNAVEAFVIPDPLGVLGPNEIYYRSSTPMKNPETQNLFHVVTGKVLIGRHPIRLPSDIQKVRAVDIPELARYSDVVIVSTKPIIDPNKGLVSLMSILSGGDVDGDIVFLIWLKELVELFQAVPLVLPPDDFEENFENQIERATDFMARILDSKSASEAQASFQETLIRGLADSNVGLYSYFHDLAVEIFGYANAITVRLAYLFNAILDSPKTGIVVRKDVYDSDRKEGSRHRGIIDSDDFQRKKARDRPFIYHDLAHYGKKLMDRYLAKYDERTGTAPAPLHDPDLLQPHLTAEGLCESAIDPAIRDTLSEDPATVERVLQKVRRSELDLVKKHVDKAYKLWLHGIQLSNSKSKCPAFITTPPYKPHRPRNHAPADGKDPKSDAIVLYAQDIPALKLTAEVEKIKASYAHSLSAMFALNMAFRVICDMKVSASNDGSAPCSRLLDQVKSISGSSRRLFEKNGA